MSAACDFVALHTGQKMPLIGLGTWKSERGQVSREQYNIALSVSRRVLCTFFEDSRSEGFAWVVLVSGLLTSVERVYVFTH